MSQDRRTKRESGNNSLLIPSFIRLPVRSSIHPFIRRILAEKYPKLASLVLDEESLTLALNEEYVPTGEVVPLKAGDVVALIPPISGG